MNKKIVEEINNNLKKIINPLSQKDIISDNTVKSTEIKNDKIVVILEIDSTQLKTMESIKIKVEEISIFRLRENKVAEQWCLADDLALLKQLQS